MKPEESKYLLQEKQRNGKELEQAKLEIKQLKQSQTDFKILNRELKKKETIIKNLNKKIEKLQKDNFKLLTKKEKKLDLPDEEKPIRSRSTQGNVATTNHLKRILLILEEADKDMTTTELSKMVSTTTSYIASGLLFLKRYELVEEIFKDGCKRYRRKYK